jgi:hypothetical protein
MNYNQKAETNIESFVSKSKKYNLTKIFKNVLNRNSRTVNLRSKLGVIGNMKYLPAFSKE